MVRKSGRYAAYKHKKAMRGKFKVMKLHSAVKVLRWESEVNAGRMYSAEVCVGNPTRDFGKRKRSLCYWGDGSGPSAALNAALRNVARHVK